MKAEQKTRIELRIGCSDQNSMNDLTPSEIINAHIAAPASMRYRSYFFFGCQQMLPPRIRLLFCYTDCFGLFLLSLGYFDLFTVGS
jgi:hypothetical protein